MELKEIMEADNILDVLDKDKTEEVYSDLKRESDKDTALHEDYIKECDEIIKTSKHQVGEPTKTFPWDGASNIKFPMILKESNTIAAMLSTAILGEDIVKGVVVGADEVEVIDKEAEGGVSMKPLNKGAKAERVSDYVNYLLKNKIKAWEEQTDRMFTLEALIGVQFKKTYYSPITKKTCSDLVDYKDLIVSEAPSVEMARRITHRFDLSRSEIVGRQRAGVYSDDVEIEEKEDDKFEINECHFFYDLDGDGYEEPYIATFIKDGDMLSLVKRYDEEMVYKNDKDEVIEIKPIEYFTKYPFIQNPKSAIYDIGFGQLLMPLNKTLNTIINQLIDAGTLANVKGGLISGSAGLKSGNSMKIKMGEYKVLPGVNDIARNVFEITGKEPSPTLFALFGALSDAAKEITSIKNVNPESVGGNMPATTTLMMIEQGLNEFKAIYKRIHRALKSEVEKILFFQTKYGGADDYLKIMDYGKSSIDDLNNEDDYMIVPVNEATSLTEGQNAVRAQAVYGAKDNNPYIDPEKATEFYLKSLKIDDFKDLMTQPQPQQPDPIAIANLELLKSQTGLYQTQTQNINKDNARKNIEAEHKFRMDELKQANEKNKTDISGFSAGVKAVVDVSTAKQDDDSLQDDIKDVKDISKKKLTVNDLDKKNPITGKKIELEEDDD